MPLCLIRGPVVQTGVGTLRVVLVNPTPETLAYLACGLIGMEVHPFVFQLDYSPMVGSWFFTMSYSVHIPASFYKPHIEAKWLANGAQGF